MAKEPSVQSQASVESEPQYPKGKLSGLSETPLLAATGFLLMWAVVVVSILFRGGRAAPGVVAVCSPMCLGQEACPHSYCGGIGW